MSCRLSILLAIGFALASSGSAGAPVRAPDMTTQSKLFVDDTRLSQKLTIGVTHIYLGELLEQFSRDAGVPLSVDDAKGPVSGIQLTLFAKDLTLRQIMEGLV